MNHHLTKKVFTLAFLLACGLTARTASAQEQQQAASARQNSTGVAAAQRVSSAQVQSSDVPLLGMLAGASPSQLPAQPQPTPAPAQTPAPTPLPVVAPTPLPN
ncbi:MAG TPA: hypothetical protein VD835_03740, partial [Pyrinomonadaceae bacterium]|nr:hypothetical protein [Pyrinomonadaceae bacterium]